MKLAHTVSEITWTSRSNTFPGSEPDENPHAAETSEGYDTKPMVKSTALGTLMSMLMSLFFFQYQLNGQTMPLPLQGPWPRGSRANSQSEGKYCEDGEVR